MNSLKKGIRRTLAVVALLVAPGACGGAHVETRTAKGGMPPRPEDARADAAYYRSRAAALATEAPAEISDTDFVRFRRGRLYAPGSASDELERQLQRSLTTAFNDNDLPGVLDVTAQILANDQACIRAHMLRAIALRKLERPLEADFHRAVSIGLLESVVQAGDGRSPITAWTAFRVKEEYEVIKVKGFVPEKQKLTSKGGRFYDVLDARRDDDSEAIRFYFDVTELYAEEYRARVE
jgi:hypothetical protein